MNRFYYLRHAFWKWYPIYELSVFGLDEKWQHAAIQVTFVGGKGAHFYLDDGTWAGKGQHIFGEADIKYGFVVDHQMSSYFGK